MEAAEIMASWQHKLSIVEKYSEPLQVLDHGHVRLVDLMGDDQAIVQAARVSYGLGKSEHSMKGEPFESSLGQTADVCTVCGKELLVGEESQHCPEGDRRLIRYLSRNRHTTPLEMCEVKLHVKMPIFVARQWIRHRTANVNEYSMRYSPAIEEFYLIGVDGWREQSKSNKQGSEGKISAAMGRSFTEESKDAQMGLLKEYERKIRYGVAREIARCDLPLSMYTEWYWKIDLHNLLHFLGLRLDAHAQLEIRVYADAIAEIVKRWVPFTWEAFVDYRRDAHAFSRQEMNLLKAIATGALAPGWHKEAGERKGVFDRFGIETVRERAAFLKALGLT